MYKHHVKSKYFPVNVSKYKGDPNNIICRSLWERSVAKFFDMREDVVSWESETFSIKYRDKASGKIRRYFPDFKVEFASGKVYVIEIKPKKEVEPPSFSLKRKPKRYLQECLKYATNISKWGAAKNYCEARGYTFQVWSEQELLKLGIPIIVKLKRKNG